MYSGTEPDGSVETTSIRAAMPAASSWASTASGVASGSLSRIVVQAPSVSIATAWSTAAGPGPPTTALTPKRPAPIIEAAPMPTSTRRPVEGTERARAALGAMAGE